MRFRPQRQKDRDVALDGLATVADLIHAVGEASHVVVAVRHGVPIPDSEPLQDGEDILLLSAASGG